MALDTFEVYGINGQTLKFLVDKDGSNNLSLITTTTSGNSFNVNNFPATQPVSGSVSVSNLPATQPVSGTVSLDNFPTIQPINNYAEFNAGYVAIGTTAVTILTLDVRPYRFASIEINNENTTSLLECRIDARYHFASYVWNPKTSTAASYTTGTARQTNNPLIAVLDASGDLNTLGAWSSGWVEMNCQRCEALRVVLRTASGTTNVTARATLKV